MKWLVRLKKEVGIMNQAGNFSFTILSSYQITLELKRFLLTIVVILDAGVNPMNDSQACIYKLKTC